MKQLTNLETSTNDQQPGFLPDEKFIEVFRDPAKTAVIEVSGDYYHRLSTILARITSEWDETQNETAQAHYGSETEPGFPGNMPIWLQEYDALMTFQISIERAAREQGKTDRVCIASIMEQLMKSGLQAEA